LKKDGRKKHDNTEERIKLNYIMTEKYTIKEKGFHPFLLSDGWQIAQLNYMKEQHIDNIDKIDIHFKTDEAFVLMAGEAVLITADITDKKPVFNSELMKYGSVYNIPKKVWHNIAMREGSEVLIIEKLNTHLGDYEYYYLDKQQIADLKSNVSQAFNENN